MRSTLFFLFCINAFCNIYSQDAIVIYNPVSKKVSYDTVIAFPNQTKDELYKTCSKFFKIGSVNKQKGMLPQGDNRLYEDSNEFIVSGIYKTHYRPRVFTDDFSCVFNLQIQFKEEKIKISFSDFTLYTLKQKTSHFGWMGSNGFGIGSSTTPMMIDGKPVEPYFLKGKTKKRHKLFYLMNKHVNKTLGELVTYIKSPQMSDDNW